MEGTERQARDTGATLALDAEVRRFEIEWAISKAARTLDAFTADEVWAILHLAGITELAHPNALGAGFLTAARAGIITNTGTTRKSSKAGAHRRALAVWRSKIFEVRP